MVAPGQGPAKRIAIGIRLTLAGADGPTSSSDGIILARERVRSERTRTAEAERVTTKAGESPLTELVTSRNISTT